MKFAILSIFLAKIFSSSIHSNFLLAVQADDHLKVESYLAEKLIYPKENQDFDPAFERNLAIRQASIRGNISTLKVLFKYSLLFTSIIREAAPFKTNQVSNLLIEYKRRPGRCEKKMIESIILDDHQRLKMLLDLVEMGNPICERFYLSSRGSFMFLLAIQMNRFSIISYLVEHARYTHLNNYSDYKTALYLFLSK